MRKFYSCMIAHSDACLSLYFFIDIINLNTVVNDGSLKFKKDQGYTSRDIDLCDKKI